MATKDMEKELRDCEDRILEAEAVFYEIEVQQNELMSKLKRMEERSEYHKTRRRLASQRAQELRVAIAVQRTQELGIAMQNVASQ